MSVKWYAMELSAIVGTIAAALALFAGLSQPAAAQISMNRPGITGIPQGKKSAAPTQNSVRPAATLTADEQKRLNTAIKHMKSKDRKKLAAALQKMTPQQRQQLLVSVKQQMAQTKKR
jgi:hypothetical protein